MKLITILVHASQALRSMADKVRRKAITSIQAGLKEIEVDLADVEARRSEHMVKAHQELYAQGNTIEKQRNAALAKVNAKFDARQNKLLSEISERRKTIALVAKGAVTELVKTRAALSRELDHLTK